MGVTDDRNDPRLGYGVDDEPRGMNEVYLVLSEAERAKGFVRPLRTSYVHVGPPGPTYELLDLTPEQAERYADAGYVKFEPYPAVQEEPSSVVGRFWTQARLDAVGKGCQAVTTMGLSIAETYARDPGFYGATFCARCQMHRKVGVDGEFVWEGTNERVGT